MSKPKKAVIPSSVSIAFADVADDEEFEYPEEEIIDDPHAPKGDMLIEVPKNKVLHNWGEELEKIIKYTHDNPLSYSHLCTIPYYGYDDLPYLTNYDLTMEDKCVYNEITTKIGEDKAKNISLEDLRLLLTFLERSVRRVNVVDPSHFLFTKDMASERQQQQQDIAHINKLFLDESYDYWIKRRKRLRKPLVRFFCPVDTVDNCSPHITFRARDFQRRVSRRTTLRWDGNAQLRKLKRIARDLSMVQKLNDLCIARETTKFNSLITDIEIFDTLLSNTALGDAFQFSYIQLKTTDSQLISHNVLAQTMQHNENNIDYNTLMSKMTSFSFAANIRNRKAASKRTTDSKKAQQLSESEIFHLLMLGHTTILDSIIYTGPPEILNIIEQKRIQMEEHYKLKAAKRVRREKDHAMQLMLASKLQSSQNAAIEERSRVANAAVVSARKEKARLDKRRARKRQRLAAEQQLRNERMSVIQPLLDGSSSSSDDEEYIDELIQFVCLKKMKHVHPSVDGESYPLYPISKMMYDDRREEESKQQQQQHDNDDNNDNIIMPRSGRNNRILFDLVFY